ncbi:zf-HC2 domain-containing protein [Colwellia sp. E150_009]
MTEIDTDNIMTKSINEKIYWEKLHVELQDLLAGYLDDELTEQEVLLIEAHLVGCQDCRDDLERQRSLAHHVNKMPIEKLTIDIFEKIQQDVLIEHNTKRNESTVSISLISKIKKYIVSFFHLYYSKNKLIMVSGWLVTAMLLIYLPFNTLNKIDQPISSIPMIDDALEQYYLLQNQDIPTTLIDIDIPAKWENSSKLASWSTEIGGLPAQAFAVRYKNQIILQYKIDQIVFFRNAKVRKSIAKNGWYQELNTLADILLLPQGDSGLIIVGPKNFLPKREFISVNSI